MKFIRATEWVDLSALGFNEAQTRFIKGASVKVLPSPHDLPVSLRSVVIDSDTTYLELEYLSSEPLAHGTYKDGVEIAYGRRSYRPHVISVKVDASKNASAYGHKISSALDSFFRVYAVGSALSPASADRLRTNVSYIKAAVTKNLKDLTQFNAVE